MDLVPAVREPQHYCCVYVRASASCQKLSCFLQVFVLKRLRHKARRIKYSKNNSNKGQNLKSLESKRDFLRNMPKPKNAICVTDTVKLLFDLLSKSCTIHFKSCAYFVDHELSQIPQSGRRQELWGNRSTCRSHFPVIIFNQDLTATLSAP